MPGYIMHMVEANLIMSKMQRKQTAEWKRDFIAGNLLPDTKKKLAKVTSHFWDPATMDRMAISPDLSRFLHKYESMLENPVVLGYYAHLYLDEQFVKAYWPQMATFYDNAGRVREKKENITKVRIGKSGKIVSRDDFFSGAYYYGDYSKLNNYFIEKYQINLNMDYTKIDDCPVVEVDSRDLYQVMQELSAIMSLCDRTKEDQVQVFSKEKLCQFLEEVSESFVQMIC